MVFSSLSFLVAFLPVLCVLYFAVPKAWKHVRQYILLLFSLVFYATGEPLYIFLILSCILITWYLARFVKKKNKAALVAAILVNVIPLIVTKYAGFAIRNINALLGKQALRIPDIVMPIGISFYTFQVITYIVDLYREKVKEQRNPLLFALYIMFFPQLIAGPIVTYGEIARELESPDVSWPNIQYGVKRFIIGLGKKVLLANQAGYIAAAIRDNPLQGLSSAMVWLCVIAYTIQIYYDFSGYSEMAIGLGAIFGFHFPENFKDPYCSKSITEFWRRWHITLGRFFRDYVYIPLGGNRVSKLRWVFNISVVWALTGLWHGASWNYIIWGVYYGALIIFERITGIGKKLPKPVGWMITAFLVIVGWSIFMCDGYAIREMLRFSAKLFFIGKELINPVTIVSLNLSGYIPFLIAGALAASPAGTWFRGKINGLFERNSRITGAVSDIALILVFAVSILFLIGGTYNPFIYFRF